MSSIAVIASAAALYAPVLPFMHIAGAGTKNKEMRKVFFWLVVGVSAYVALTSGIHSAAWTTFMLAATVLVARVAASATGLALDLCFIGADIDGSSESDAPPWGRARNWVMVGIGALCVGLLITAVLVVHRTGVVFDLLSRVGL